MYCVYLTIYHGNKLPPFYIGSTSIKAIEEKSYHGSVKSKQYQKIWKKELIKNPHLFSTKVICKFKTRKEALKKEEKLQIMLNVVNNSLYINLATARGKFGILTCGHTTKHSRETKKLISEKLKLAYKEGRASSPFSRMNFAGENNPFFGKKHTEETIRKMRKPKSFVPRFYCEYCKGNFTRGNWVQYHGPNCKFADPKYVPPRKRTRSEAARERQRIVCPYCKKEGPSTQMKRWHFDNCKAKTT